MIDEFGCDTSRDEIFLHMLYLLAINFKAFKDIGYLRFFSHTELLNDSINENGTD